MVTKYDNKELFLDYKYKLFRNKKLGFGSFGQVYLGQNIMNKSYNAIKVEKISNTQTSILKYEYSILKYLQGLEGIPQCYYFTKIKEYNFLIMDLLGPNLSFLLNQHNNHFSINTIINIGIQMIERIEEIHKRHIIHRDIKPGNFLIGNSENSKNIIYLIDFGLSKRFRNPKTGNHILYKDDKKFIGTTKFSSIYSQLGIEQSRRDDLEGIIYSLIYLFKGFLPWSNLKAKNKEEKFHKILEKKININVDILCQDMPLIFPQLLMYTRSLLFEEKPDYDLIKNKLIEELNYKYSILNNDYDWIDNKENSIVNLSNLREKKEDDKISNSIKVMSSSNIWIIIN